MVKFRDNVSYIGSYAFLYSNVKEIYFFGDPPKFGEKPFQDLNITFYYPENNRNWNSLDLSTLGLKDSKIGTWFPIVEENVDEVIEGDEENEQNEQKQEDKSPKKKSNAVVIVVVVIFISLIICIISFIIFRKLRKKNSENINSVSGALLD